MVNLLSNKTKTPCFSGRGFINYIADFIVLLFLSLQQHCCFELSGNKRHWQGD
jgi:hypothetical protein